MQGGSVAVFAACVAVCSGFIVLKDKEYIQLNDRNGGKSLNASTYNRLAFDPKHSILYVTVGAEAIDIKFAQDCGILLVANRGRPTKEGRDYRDPQGTVSKILLPADLNPDSPLTSSTISFNGAFAGDFPSEDVMELREKNFRYYPLRDPQNNLLTIMQNMEPERLVISPSGNIAFVSLPKNNAIARLTLDFDQVTRVFPMGNRSWTNYHLDPSDKDNEINLRGYNIYSLSQATEMAWITKGNDEWIVTLDTGKLNYHSAYGYADHDRAKAMSAKGSIATSDSKLQAQLNNDTELGRLFVSTEDGKNNAGNIENVFTFGGRGFGIRDANNFETPTVVVDSVETETERYFSSVFNTAFGKQGNTPQTDKEATSPSLGPELTAQAVGEYDGKTVLFMGGGSSGILYVFMLSPDARCLQPYFHSIHRRGDTLSTWQTSYAAGKMGDIGITDMMFIETTEIRPILVVAAATSNSVSLYGIADEAFTPGSVRT
ncbi:hypothetical protein V1264_024899 [Littorina saxatilis]|uniref:Choice-of-anchor I domain-containing protein n=1 Tax=Littorina saxatilis TaxID=31220 RepID=A0AAN9FZ39_9CAEN